ncbi:oligosaccharide flippase family protein [Vibrio ulleungensis]|uniref:Oligosaccharide flippase family protein n=1 Tax=Vibrio ulleungensis TaxID=2807619 RepID=A0ABS2HFF8_9VIBR|nr:oligosaccharide flippase family protein [Vibrio ulleungensis]MBM7036288.1 oligosaccharide flippase family protein [Vibrio ulleungensis]
MKKENIVKLVWVFVEKIVLTLLAFISNILIIRALGGEGFGALSYYYLIVYLIFTLSDLGFRRVYLSMRDSAYKRQFFNYLLKTKFLLLIPSTAIISYYLRGSIPDYQLVTIAVLTLLQPIQSYFYICQSKLKIKQISLFHIVIESISSFSKIAVFYVSDNMIFHVVLIHVTVSIIKLIGYLMLSEENLVRDMKLFFTPIKSRVKKLNYSNSYRALYLFMSLILLTYYNKLDQLIVEAKFGFYALGIYVAAYKFIEQIISLLGMINSFLLPMISNENKAEKLESITTIYIISIVVSICLAIFMYALGGHIIRFTLGEEYSESIAILELLAISLPMLFLSNVGGIYYSVQKIEHLALIRNFLSCAVMFTLGHLLTNRMGLEGIAVALIVTSFFNVFIFEILHRKTRFNVTLKIQSIKQLFSIHFWKKLAHDIK